MVFNTLNNLHRRVHPALLIVLLFPVIILDGWLAIQALQYFQPLVTIVLIAALLAFVLDYPVQLLQRHEVKHAIAVLIVFTLTLVILAALGITLIPRLIEELSQIAVTVPNWIESSNQRLQEVQSWLAQRHLPVNLSLLGQQITNLLPRGLQSLADRLLTLTISTVGSATEALLTIALTFYFLLDGAKMWDSIFRRFPQQVALPIEESLGQNFQNYFIGQATLASLMGSSMTILFLILKVPFALLFGLGVGILTFIPFGSFLSVCSVSLIVATQDPILGFRVLLLGVLVNQIMDQAIAPRLLSRFTGLRPAWVLISLLIGTKVLGLIGLIVAVPLAGFVKDMLGEPDDSVPSLQDSISSLSIDVATDVKLT